MARGEEVLKAAAEELRSAGGEVTIFVGDVSKVILSCAHAQVQRAVLFASVYEVIFCVCFVFRLLSKKGGVAFVGVARASVRSS